MTPRLLTASSLKAARACMRLYQYTYALGIRPVRESETTRFGTLWHAGQEAWWLGPDGDARLDAGLASIAVHCLHREIDPFDRVKAEELLRGYHFLWIDRALETLRVEVEFRAPHVNPATGAASRTWTLGGKIDAVARAEGRILIVEHKTSSEDIGPGSDYWRRLRLDGQVGMYFEGATALGYDPAGCLYDVVGKPRIKPLKATAPEARKYTKAGALYAAQRSEDETPEEYRARLRASIAEAPAQYYQRGELVRLEAEREDYLHDIWQLGRMIREAELANRWPRNPDSCVRYGRTCEFFDACTGVASLDDETLFRRIQIAHPELAASATQTTPPDTASAA